jgi:LuxR family maltose regulon positive regulatory protein
VNLNAGWQARLWLAQGEQERVSRWIDDHGVDASRTPTYTHEMEHILLARIFMAQGQLDAAIRLLQRQLGAAITGGRVSRVVEMLMLRALAHQAKGHSVRAKTTLKQCLTFAEPGGFVRVFVDEGLPMEALLKKIRLADGKMNEYVRKLLAAFTDRPLPSSTLSLQALVEPLSQREIEVLQLIADGLTNQEIATKLYLSLNTVKVHTRNINGKLGVHSRTKAVVSARALGVLPSV